MTEIDGFDEGVASDAAAETASTSATPIAEILSSSSRDEPAADVPARPAQEDREERSRIPIAALRRERERRERMDREVERLEAEITKYNDQKWGFSSNEEHSPKDDPNPSDWVHADKYDRAYKAFATRNPEKLAEVNRALNGATESQKAEILDLVGQTGDPQAVIDYLDKAGLLFRRASIQDALAGNTPHDPAASAEMYKLHEHMRSIEAREQQLAVVERAHVERGSQASFAQRHGHETLMSVDGVVGAMLERGHPLVPNLQQIYQSSPDPTGAVAAALHEWGLWSPEAAQPQRPAPVFPSNFAGARNVAPRSGPAWSGPKPLRDIFNRARG